MRSGNSNTLDDILFEERNRDYGSYKLRKRYPYRLALSFLISVVLITLLSLGYSWFLNKAGDESIYFYSSSGPRLKSATGSLMSQDEMEAYMNAPAAPQDALNEAKAPIVADNLHSFVVTENPVNDTPPTLDSEPDPAATGTDMNLEGDSAYYGGFIIGNGQGGGVGGNIDQMPQFSWGNPTRYVEMNLQYPAQAMKKKIHGVVIISFVINKNGEVVNVRVERSVDPVIDEAAVRTIQGMPRWIPGMVHGRPVNIQFRIPINFVPLS
jgi:protein TonB